MAAITDYATLLQALVDISEDDGAEFSAYAPTAIDIAEERLIKELDFPELEKDQATQTLTTNRITKPADYRLPISLKLFVTGNSTIAFSAAFSGEFASRKTSSGYINMKKRLSDFIEDYWPDDTATGTPKYYGDISDTEFIVAPTPNSSYTYKLRYLASPVKLSLGNTTNYFTDHCKDILYAACMVEMCYFMKAWSEVATWEQRFQKLASDWNFQAQRQRRDNGETPMNQYGPNTVKHTQGSAA